MTTRPPAEYRLDRRFAPFPHYSRTTTQLSSGLVPHIIIGCLTDTNSFFSVLLLSSLPLSSFSQASLAQPSSLLAFAWQISFLLASPKIQISQSQTRQTLKHFPWPTSPAILMPSSSLLLWLLSRVHSFTSSLPLRVSFASFIQPTRRGFLN